MPALSVSPRRVIAALLAISLLSSRAEEPALLTLAQRAEDFASFCRFVEEEYAYFDLKATDWKRTCAFHAAQVAGATDRDAYVGLLERALGELYDPHAHLGTNTRSSYRLVPTHADLLATWSGGKAVLAAVRAGSSAEKAGLVAGMEVLAIHGEPVETVVARIEPRFLSRDDPAAHHWALQVALAGRRDREATTLTIRSADGVREFAFAAAVPEPTSPLSHRVVGNVATVRIHNSLGQQALVQAFDRALLEMAAAQALVIDLRDTPSGGNSSVARGLMGRLVERELAYQRHELVAEFRSTGIRRVWVEYVSPRGAPWRKPVVVLVGPWTGSMGEGLAIGLNATRAAPVLGRPMAHLLGANGETVLPHSRIVVRVPTEKLFHVDGTPREAFVPCAIDRSRPDSHAEDPELESAVELASRRSRLKSPAAAEAFLKALRTQCSPRGKG